jgi:CO/xanthine dehydrogenase Mo-binding subunit
MAKVPGQTIYARDVQARDMEGWPARALYAMVLRTPVAGGKLEGIELIPLPQDLQPRKKVCSHMF